MKEKVEIHSSVCRPFIETVFENNLPVNVHVGRPYREPNGSLQNPVELEYDKKDEEIVKDALVNSINMTLELK